MLSTCHCDDERKATWRHSFSHKFRFILISLVIILEKVGGLIDLGFSLTDADDLIIEGRKKNHLPITLSVSDKYYCIIVNQLPIHSRLGLSS